ncbi:hypothetical protein PCANC_24936 [Puccinia coronata f. sp. avenae]|uniref:Uncharacterized protein n=1 Tax=Puccinia coronata f. sp. avenae TaxID=200324 RepID=A0A2N5S7S9_9BASI|nr:hypothetical protein PCANC_24936 [Puccinia coronata f. sp. avenae]
MCAKSAELFELVITLGEDSTVLFASWFFRRIVPPIIPVALGSLGFLTNFDCELLEALTTRRAVRSG